MYCSGVFEPSGTKELDSVNTVRKFQTDPKFTPRRATKPEPEELNDRPIGKDLPADTLHELTDHITSPSSLTEAQ